MSEKSLESKLKLFVLISFSDKVLAQIYPPRLCHRVSVEFLFSSSTVLTIDVTKDNALWWLWRSLTCHDLTNPAAYSMLNDKNLVIGLSKCSMSTRQPFSKSLSLFTLLCSAVCSLIYIYFARSLQSKTKVKIKIEIFFSPTHQHHHFNCQNPKGSLLYGKTCFHIWHFGFLWGSRG